VPERVVDQVAHQDGEGVRVHPRHQRAGRPGREPDAVADAGGAFAFGDHEVEDRSEVDGVGRNRQPRLRPAEVDQLAGERAERLQGGLDRPGAVAQRPLGNGGDEALRLHQGTGDRGAQLVRGVGGEAALGLERPPHARHQAVDLAGERRDLLRQSLRSDLVEGVAVPALDVAPELDRRRQAAPDDDPDPEPAEAQDHRQRGEQAEARAQQGGAAARQRIGDLDHEGAADGALRIETVVVVLAEARHGGLRERDTDRVRRPEAHHPGRVAHHIDVAALVGEEAGDPLGSLLGLAGVAVEDVLDGERQQALRHLELGGVEGTVEGPAGDRHRQRRGGQPQDAEEGGERDQQPAADARHRRHGRSIL
jgi:hypothetical protein